MLYICLKFDDNIRLINYSYYAKYVQLENSTFFCHIDMNVKKYLQIEHDDNIIQEFVSLNDEIEKSCTKIVLEFHKHIKN